MVYLYLFVAWMTAHGTTVTLLGTKVRISVKLLEVLQATGVEHVGAVEQTCLLVVDEWIETDWAVSITSLHCLSLDTFPELVKLLSLSALFTHCESAFLLLVERSLDIWEERLE